MKLFADLRRQLADLQKPQTLNDLHNRAGVVVHELVMDGFRGEHDPYGVPWKPTKRKNPILQDTLALRDGIRWKADSRALVFQTTGRANRYAAYHQNGTQASQRSQKASGRFISAKRAARSKRVVLLADIPGLPARQFLPDQDHLSPRYVQALQNDFRAYFRQRYGAR